ncbi:hypothetical protein T12_3591, partial [Trichinella patagoniensis]
MANIADLRELFLRALQCLDGNYVKFHLYSNVEATGRLAAIHPREFYILVNEFGAKEKNIRNFEKNCLELLLINLLLFSMTEYVQLPSDHIRGVHIHIFIHQRQVLSDDFHLSRLTLCVTWKRCVYINKSGQETFSTNERVIYGFLSFLLSKNHISKSTMKMHFR